MLVAGGLLVGAALFIARRPHTGPEAALPVRDFSVGTPAAAITAAAVAAATVTAVIVMLAVI